MWEESWVHLYVNDCVEGTEATWVCAVGSILCELVLSLHISNFSGLTLT